MAAPKRIKLPLSEEEKDCLKNIFYAYRDKNEEDTDDLEKLFSKETISYNAEELHAIIVDAIKNTELEDSCRRLMTFLKIRIEVKTN